MQILHCVLQAWVRTGLFVASFEYIPVRSAGDALHHDVVSVRKKKEHELYERLDQVAPGVFRGADRSAQF